MILLEPFANKPTMLFVCESLNRIYHGAEIDGKKAAAFKWLWENKHGVLAHEVLSSALELQQPQAPLLTS